MAQDSVLAQDRRAAAAISAGSGNKLQQLAVFFFFAGLVFFLIPLCMDWNQPLAGMHGFRQTQTAISVQYMLKGGPWLGYETPVLGAPWTIPYEFPLYQWCVALAYEVLPLSLDQAGRLVNWSFFLLTLWPLWVIIRRLGGDRTLFYMLGALLFFSPEYAFWSSSFMIESTALLLGVSFVAFLLVYLDKPALPMLALLAAAASLAALVKVTTFVAFGAAGGILVLRDFYMRYNRTPLKSLAVRYSGPAAAMVLALLLAVVWVHYCDALKSRSVLGDLLIASKNTEWNFGTWRQLAGSEFWSRVSSRMIPDMFGMRGYIWGFCFLGSWGCILFRHRAQAGRALAASFVLVGLFVLPLVVFTNLHFIHNYYQYENAIFLIAATAVLLWQLQKILSPFMAMYLFILMVASQGLYGINWYYSLLKMDKNQEPAIQVASFIRDHTPQGSIIMVLGYDWSSIIPYYADRRAIMIPGPVMHDDTLKTIVTSPDTVTRGAAISLFADCSAPSSETPVRRALLDALEQEMTTGMKMEPVTNCKIFYREEKL